MTRILAIDDERYHLSFISTLLERIIPESTVITAESGVTGIQKAKEILPDTILLDVDMPDVDGFEVCRRLKTDQETRHIPIIMLTGVGLAVENRVKGLEVGADAYLTKPVESSELTAQIKAVHRIKENEEQLRRDKELQEDLIRRKTQALAERERAFFTLTDNLPGMAYRCRNDIDWTMEFVSSGCRELTGYDSPELINNHTVSYGELIHPEDREKVWKDVQHALSEGRAFTITYRIKASGGAEKWVWEQGRGVTAPTGRLLAVEGFVIDITERKRLEDALVSRENWLAQTLQGSPIAVFIVDKNHVVTHWNRGCEALTGYSGSQMVGKRLQWKPFYTEKRPVLADLIVDGDLDRFHELYGNKRAQRAKTVQDAWEAYDFFRDLGGKPRHVHFMAAPIRDVEGNVIGAIETLQDITRQKAFEYELMQSEKRYRVLTEQVADGVAVIQEGTFAFVNDPLVAMFGHQSQENLLDRKITDFVCGESKRMLSRLRQEVETGTVPSQVVRMKCKKSDQSDFWIETHNRFIDWRGRGAVLATVRDITELKRQEEALKKESEDLRHENIRLKSSIKDRYKFRNIIGKSPSMQRLYEQILEAAATDAPVIIYGESGTGKELAAKAIHDLSNCSDNEFVTVNCGAIPETLLESEFFGHKKGAFTGAHCDKHGYLDSADGGSLFLDEVGELGLNMQVKLLRALEGGGYTPVGGGTVRNSRFRVIAATNRDLKDLVRRGLFRDDFFYRIHVIPITLPPLRDRKEDIPLLVDHFLQVWKGEDKPFTLPVSVLESLQTYHWPGNVRELQNVLNRYCTSGRLDFLSVRVTEEVPAPTTEPEGSPQHGDSRDLRTALQAFEKEHIMKTLAHTKWNRSKAASILGISRKTLFRKMKSFGPDPS